MSGLNIDNAVDTFLETPIEICADDVLAIIGMIEDNPSSITTSVDSYKYVIADFLEKIYDIANMEEEEEEEEEE